MGAVLERLVEAAKEGHQKEMDELNQIATLYKRYPDLYAPPALINNIRELVHSRRYELL